MNVQDMKKESHITEGCIVIFQRGSFIKPCRVTSARPHILGKKRDSLQVSFNGVVGQPFGSTFKLVSCSTGGRNCYNLQKLTWTEMKEAAIQSEGGGGSGVDNRDLTDDGTSQKLSREQILQLKASGASGEQVIQAITANSATFNSKTKYSQQKYVSKKGKKYTEPVTLHKPTIDIVADMFFQEPFKIASLRPDTLFQVLSYSNVTAGGRVAVFDSGTLSLVTAALLHRLGGLGRMVHVFAGDSPIVGPIWTGLSVMDFSTEEMASMSYMNINRLHTANKPGKPDGSDMKPLIIEDDIIQADGSIRLMNGGGARTNGITVPIEEAPAAAQAIVSSDVSTKGEVASGKEDEASEVNDACEAEIRSSREKIDNNDNNSISKEDNEIKDSSLRTDITASKVEEDISNSCQGDSDVRKRTEAGQPSARPRNRKFLRNREQDESVSRAVLEAGVYSLVVAAGKRMPAAPTLALLPYLLPGCPFVVFSPYKESLAELYQALKTEGATNLRLSETWLREYQVLPERTHPTVNMSGGGGYLLCGTKIRTGGQF